MHGMAYDQLPMLEAIASSIASRPTKVRLDRQVPTAYYNPKQSLVVINRDATANAARGFLAHELLHERYTFPKDWEKVTDLAPYHNLVEDIRINNGCAPLIYRNAAGWIYDTWHWLREKQPGRVWDAGAPSASFLYRAHRQTQKPKPWDQEVEAFYATHNKTILGAANIAVLRPVLEALKALDEKYKPKTDEPDKNGDGEPQPGGDQPGEGNGTGGPGPAPTPEPPQPGESVQAGRRRAKRNREAQREHQRKVNEANEAAKAEKALKALTEGAATSGSPFHQGHTPMVITEADTGSDDEAGARSTKTGFDDGSDGYAQIYNDRQIPTDPDAINNLRAWRNRVAEALMAEDANALNRNLQRGRLDGTRLAHIAANTSDRVFAKPQLQRRAVNTAVDIMLDISSSTGAQESRILHNLAASAYAVAEACSRVPGVQLGMLRYGSGVQRILPITHNRNVRLEQAKSLASGCTETDVAVLKSTTALRMADAQRRICINCTDGANAEPETEQLCKDLGVEYYELHIVDEGDDHLRAEQHDSRTYCTGDTIHQGLDRLIRTLHIRGH